MNIPSSVSAIAIAAALLLAGCGAREATYGEGPGAPSVQKDGITATLTVFKQNKDYVIARILVRNATPKPFIIRTPRGAMTSFTAKAGGQEVIGQVSSNELEGDSGDRIGLSALRGINVARQAMTQGKFTVEPGGYQKIDVRFNFAPPLKSKDESWTIIMNGFIDDRDAVLVELTAPAAMR